MGKIQLSEKVSKNSSLKESYWWNQTLLKWEQLNEPLTSSKFSKFSSDFRKETTAGIWECDNITRDSIVVICKFVGIMQLATLEELRNTHNS